MADFGAPIAQNVNPVGQGVQTLSGLLGIKQQQQALQTGAIQQQTAQAEAQQQQQTAGQRAGIAHFMATFDPSKHVGSDGTLDLDEVLTDPKLRQAAGDQFPALMQQLVGVKQSQLGAKQQLADLNSTLRNQFSSTVGSLRTDPDVVKDTPAGRQKVSQALDDFAETGGPDAARVANVYGQVIGHVPPGKLTQTLSNFQLQAMDAATQAGKQAPTLTSTGAQQVNVNPQAAGGNLQGTPPITNQLPPTIVTSPVTGGQGVVGGGQGLTPRPIGGAGGPNAWQPYAGQQGDIKTYQAEVQNTRTAADAAPTARNINAQILRLADSAKTGPGTEVWQHAVGALAAPFGLSPTASYQELGKFLEKNAIQNMTSMGGPPSDARLSAAAAANGSTHFSPEALKAVTKFNDATNTALMEYRQGMDRAVGMGQNVDYTRLPAFKAAWAKNFDVDVFRVENAIRDGDKAELTQIRQQLGPKRMRELAEKSANLRMLEQGQIPNG